LVGLVKTKKKYKMENLKKLAELNDLAQQEGEKFFSGNKSAGTRLRKVLLEIKNLSHEIRKQVSEIKK
jgi:hypothetical protein